MATFIVPFSRVLSVSSLPLPPRSQSWDFRRSRREIRSRSAHGVADTLAAVAAERLEFDGYEEVLLTEAVAGVNVQANGGRLKPLSG
jgi:hypothetical protein